MPKQLSNLPNPANAQQSESPILYWLQEHGKVLGDSESPYPAKDAKYFWLEHKYFIQYN